MRKWALASCIALGLVFGGAHLSSAVADHGHRGHHGSHGHHGHHGHGGHYHYYPGHFHYHNGHYDYHPGHYHYHRGGHGHRSSHYGHGYYGRSSSLGIGRGLSPFGLGGFGNLGIRIGF